MPEITAAKTSVEEDATVTRYRIVSKTYRPSGDVGGDSDKSLRRFDQLPRSSCLKVILADGEKVHCIEKFGARNAQTINDVSLEA